MHVFGAQLLLLLPEWVTAEAVRHRTGCFLNLRHALTSSSWLPDSAPLRRVLLIRFESYRRDSRSHLPNEPGVFLPDPAIIQIASDLLKFIPNRKIALAGG